MLTIMLKYKRPSLWEVRFHCTFIYGAYDMTRLRGLLFLLLHPPLQSGAAAWALTQNAE